MTEKKRDYKKEYREYHGKPEQIAARAQRNAARAKVGLAVGDKRECDHKNPISNGGSNRKDNLRAVSQATNRRKGSGKK
jgi:5-methylcytosine-specific restriction endonuclease McrA